MTNKITKKWPSMLLAALVIFRLVFQATAATDYYALDNKVRFNVSTGSCTVSGTTVDFSVESSRTAAVTSTIYVYNSGTKAATISFGYSASTSSTTFTLEGSAVTSGSYTSTVLQPDAYLTLTLKATNGFLSKRTATLKLTGLTYTEAADSSNVTFTYDSTKGSVTVAGSPVADGDTVSVPITGAALVATPKDSTYSFLGWVNTATHQRLSADTPYTLTPSGNMTVQAIFVKTASDQAWFLVDDATKYLTNDLNKASKDLGTKIVLANNGTLATGTYTIQSGDTLLIPFDPAHTLYTTSAEHAGETMTTPTAYRTLTMASGVNIVINGAMSVSGKHAYTNAGGQSNSPSGPLGFVDMESGSSITVNGALYAYGYIIGDGAVTAKSGSVVYELFQMPEFRGGSQSTSMQNNVFPLSQYYVQNIEVPLTLEVGAREYAYGTLALSALGNLSYYDTGAYLFGNSSNAGIFTLSEGKVTKWYDGTQDRIFIEIDGTITMAPIDLKVDWSSINSKNFVLPINGGYTIHLINDSSLTIPSTQKVLMQPGSQLIIDKGASVTVDSALYVYDTAQWGAYCIWGHSGAYDSQCWDAPVIPVSYSPTRTKTRWVAIPRSSLKDSAGNPISITNDPAIYEAVFGLSDANSGDYINKDDLANFLTNYLPDASILVNGSLTGNIYTTANGANIYSTDSGTFTQKATANSSVYQFKMSGDYDGNSGYDEASCPPAQLKNENTTGGEYTATAATSNGATTYYYDATHKRWVLNGHTVQSVVTPPTCTAEGYTTNTCACGYVYQSNVVSATGHNFGDWQQVVAPTCNQAGSQTRSCACGETQTESIEAHGHIPVTDAAVAATCTAAGKTEGKHCDTCGEVIVAQEEVAALGHKEVVDAAVDATCTETGLTAGSHCSVCSEVLVAQNPVAALGHKEVIDEAVEPTCTETGLTEGKHCSVCSEVLVAQNPVAALGHSYESEVTEPTCTVAGFTTHTCTVCGDTYKDTETNPTGVHTDTQTSSTQEGFLKCDGCDIPLVRLAAIEASADAATELRMKFYIHPSLTTAEDGSKLDMKALVQFAGVKATEETVSLSNMETDKSGRYVFICNVNSGEMRRDMTVSFTDASGNPVIILDGQTNTNAVSRSVADYAELVLDRSQDERQKNVIKHLLTYGGYAQIHFNVDADNPVYNLLTDRGIAIPDLEGTTIPKVTSLSTSVGDIVLKQAEVFLQSAIKMQYTYTADTPDDDSFLLTYVYKNQSYPKAVTPVEAGTIEGKPAYTLSVDEIPAAYFGHKYALDITEGTTDGTVSMSVYDYLYLRLQPDDEGNTPADSLINLAKAMYLYGEAANEFFFPAESTE